MGWYIYVSPWSFLSVKVMIMHISTLIILEIVAARENITITNKHDVLYQLSIHIFAFELGPFQPVTIYTL